MPSGTEQHSKLGVTDEEIHLHKKRTYRHLLTRQLLIQHSYDAALIVVYENVRQYGVIFFLQDSADSTKDDQQLSVYGMVGAYHPDNYLDKLSGSI